MQNSLPLVGKAEAYFTEMYLKLLQSTTNFVYADWQRSNGNLEAPSFIASTRYQHQEHHLATTEIPLNPTNLTNRSLRRKQYP